MGETTLGTLICFLVIKQLFCFLCSCLGRQALAIGNAFSLLAYRAFRGTKNMHYTMVTVGYFLHDWIFYQLTSNAHSCHHWHGGQKPYLNIGLICGQYSVLSLFQLFSLHPRARSLSDSCAAWQASRGLSLNTHANT